MIIDPEATPVQEVYRHLTACVTPRPIAWVSTISEAGVPNLAPFSFFNAIGANPAAVIFSPVNRRDGSRKDTILNLEKTPEFVLNIVSDSLARQMNATSAELPYETDEFEFADLARSPAARVRPPRVRDAQVHLECVLHQILPIGHGPLAANLVIGRVVLIEVNDRVLDAAGQIDPGKLDTIGRLGGSLYTRTRDRFAMERPR
ncbi:MAG TPA: flavin reductase family protein [Tepidisphaeraceae bacterium]|nr:flavin reductase family protein [Tepidisphaeraceae bacterium]